MDVIAAANARQAALPAGAPHVIRMEVGQPGTGAPAGAVDAARQALAGRAPLGYTEALGRHSLRSRIAAHGQDWYGFAADPARIAVTMGASAAFPLVFLAAFDPGDRIAMAAPYYPPYRNIAVALGLVPVVIETGVQTRYQPTVAMLEALDPRPDGLIVASPCNPAGTMLHRDELDAIARWCHANGVRLVSDEIYHGLQYGQEIATAAQFSPSAVVVNSFSKYFSMTGWRVGWMVLPADLVRPVECLAQNLFISARTSPRSPPRRRSTATTSCRPTSPATAGRATCWWTRCQVRGSTGCRQRKGRSTCMPMSRRGQTTAPASAPGCWPKPASPRPEGGFRSRARPHDGALQLLRARSGHGRSGGAAASVRLMLAVALTLPTSGSKHLCAVRRVRRPPPELE